MFFSILSSILLPIFKQSNFRHMRQLLLSIFKRIPISLIVAHNKYTISYAFKLALHHKHLRFPVRTTHKRITLFITIVHSSQRGVTGICTSCIIVIMCYLYLITPHFTIRNSELTAILQLMHNKHPR